MSRIIARNDVSTVYMGISSNIIRTIEFASRLCYDAGSKMTPDSWSKYIGARVRSGHESVIEHGMITVIIDPTTVKQIPLEWMYDEIMNVEDVLVNANSLIHFIKEQVHRPDAPQLPLMILSGNLKMWRDLFKYIFANHCIESSNHGVIYTTIIHMFELFDSYCDGIFTQDIPEMNRPSNYIQSGYGFNQNEVEAKLVTEWSSVNIPTIDYMERIYNDGRGSWTSIISCDNFLLDFNILDTTPGYVKIFIQKHIKDIHSVSYITRMPRIITQQEARHRINSISQRSQRYVTESYNEHGFYVPEEIDPSRIYTLKIDGNEIRLSYDTLMKLNSDLYSALISDSVRKEDARFVLPNSIFSEMVVTKPFYTLPHYFKERCSNAAQKEIREPAKALKEYLNNRFNRVVGSNPLFE